MMIHSSRQLLFNLCILQILLDITDEFYNNKMLFGLGFREKEEQECGAVWLFTKPDFFSFTP